MTENQFIMPVESKFTSHFLQGIIWVSLKKGKMGKINWEGRFERQIRNYKDKKKD